MGRSNLSRKTIGLIHSSLFERSPISVEQDGKERNPFQKGVSYQLMTTKESLLLASDTIRILIAEDDDSLREILREFLRAPQRIIETCKNGEEALPGLGKSMFDIVVTDLVMPKVDGLQVLREAKGHHPDCVVIIITGYASLDTAIEAIRGGAYDYIRKPFKLEELAVVVNNACEKIALVRENRRLFQRLKETTEEVSRLRESWERHLSNILGICCMISNEERNSEMEFALKQISPLPPDYDSRKMESQEKAFESLERLVRLRKEGFLTEDEFLSLKKALLKKLELP
ncbi:MAG: response regulator [Thermodesulfobacteriota bacterium]